LNHGGAALEKILRAHITDAAREAILSGNARRLLGGEDRG
jgi:predicted TIM-barrel fold metal-dependent hydrolase